MSTSDYLRPLDAGVARLVGQLDADRREAFEERAGILQYDAKLPRLDAERTALLHILARYGLVGSSRLRLLQAMMDGATWQVLTCDVDAARVELVGRGASAIAEVALLDVLQAHFGGAAVLGAVP